MTAAGRPVSNAVPVCCCSLLLLSILTQSSSPCDHGPAASALQKLGAAFVADLPVKALHCLYAAESGDCGRWAARNWSCTGLQVPTACCGRHLRMHIGAAPQYDDELKSAAWQAPSNECRVDTTACKASKQRYPTPAYPLLALHARCCHHHDGSSNCKFRQHSNCGKAFIGTKGQIHIKFVHGHAYVEHRMMLLGAACAHCSFA
jgi:hypothetical protein